MSGEERLIINNDDECHYLSFRAFRSWPGLSGPHAPQHVRRAILSEHAT